ncbi:hypothetical protein OIU84_008126 [Salix udensis]|uniref:Uncharacterized protein n=1 Tax=Salix udensis TaxID=889485 RepID=A0AAD6JUN1_9ROSI|nr:hypothetical protein OIU84_008126 [Salix udensis]
MESDEFGSNANGPSGEEDVVNAKLDHRGGRIREFNHKVGGGKESRGGRIREFNHKVGGGKESRAHANVRRKTGGATSDERWLRNSTGSSNSDLEDLHYRHVR